ARLRPVSPSPIAARVTRNISFRDSRINGGAKTEGFIQLLGQNIDMATHVIQLQRLIFDDESQSRPTDLPLTFPEWVDPARVAAEAAAAAAAAERSRLQKRLRRLQRNLRKARRLQRSSEVRRLSRQVRKVRRQIRALS
ncbi:MAG: hypothetical protein AAGC68_11845, partial [Verrucomicrobiota bacterium]